MVARANAYTSSSGRIWYFILFSSDPCACVHPQHSFTPSLVHHEGDHSLLNQPPHPAAARAAGESFEVDFPYPFITKGANPVHVYDDVEVLVSGCYSYSVANDITHQFEIAYSSSTITITPEVPLSGVTWITLHLDYGLKKTGGYEMHLYKDDADVWRAHAMKDLGSIYDLTDYVFTVSGPVSDSQTIQNRNEFKKIRGIAGQITGAGAGVEVSIFGGSIDTIVLTDDDGWYGLEFKHKGKAVDYTIETSGYTPQIITLKAAHFSEVNFGP